MRKTFVRPKKASAYRSHHVAHGTDPGFSGTRVATPTGAQVAGFSGKDFETRYEIIAPQASWPLYWHPTKTKTRVIRVVSGTGLLLIGEATAECPLTDTEMKTVLLNPGDEVVLPGNVAYKLFTTVKSDLHLFVVQSSNYSSKLVELQDAGVAPSVEYLLSPQEPQMRRGSRASQQLQELERQKKAESMYPSQTPEPQRLDTFHAGVNPRPSMGNLIDD